MEVSNAVAWQARESVVLEATARAGRKETKYIWVLERESLITDLVHQSDQELKPARPPRASEWGLRIYQSV